MFLPLFSCSSPRWLQTKPRRCDRGSRRASRPGVSASARTSRTHHIMEERRSQHWRPRWEDHCKTLHLLSLRYIWKPCDLSHCHSWHVGSSKRLKPAWYIRLMCLNVWDRTTQQCRSSHYQQFGVCWKIDLFGSLFTYSNYQTPKQPILVAATFNDWGR